MLRPRAKDGVRPKIERGSGLLEVDRPTATPAHLDTAERRQIMADFSEEWVYWVAPNGEVLYVSPSAERITGYSPAAFVHSPNLLRSIVHPEDLDAFDRHLAECHVHSCPDVGFLQHRVTTKNGAWIWLEHRCREVWLPDGTRGGRRIGHWDITAHKTHLREEIETQVRESEERYRHVFQDSPASQLVVDPETGRILDANPAACRYYGYQLETLVRMSITDINTLSREEAFAEMARARAEQRNHFLFTHRLANGEVRPVEVYSGPILRNGRKVLHSIVHDISKRKSAEAEKERLIVGLREALSKIKTLSGLLPMCAACKRIRNDHGYWEQLEEYIGAHSEAEFTHGICPECCKHLYPELRG